jgi:hypothetical protein
VLRSEIAVFCTQFSNDEESRTHIEPTSDSLVGSDHVAIPPISGSLRRCLLITIRTAFERPHMLPIPIQAPNHWSQILGLKTHTTETVLVAALVFILGIVIFHTIFGQQTRNVASGSPSHQPLTALQNSPTEISFIRQVVVCPECSTMNSSEYRFCRQCVADLSKS